MARSQRFWLGFEEVYRVLRPDGVFLVACPFYFHQHAYPSDYWRFTPEAFGVLLADYPQRILGWHGPDERPENIWCLAFREGYAPISQAQFARYQTHLPRAGVWMVWIKRLFAFVMFGVAEYYLIKMGQLLI